MKIAIFERKHAYVEMQNYLPLPQFRDIFEYRQYDSYEDIIEQYLENKDTWDGILFSGPVGYNYFMNNTDKVSIPVMYIVNNFEVYYIKLLSHLTTSDIPLSQVYIDTQNDFNFIDPLRAALPESKMPQILCDYDDFRDDMEEYLYQQIKGLWDSGKIKIAYVAQPGTYNLLAKAGVPCEKIEFNSESIVKGLESIKRQARLNMISNSNNVVLLVDFLVKQKHEFNLNEVEYRRATLYKVLVDFKRNFLNDVEVNINGGTTSFELSFSRKELDIFNREKVPLSDYLNANYKMDYIMGVGIGNNITECRVRAENALEFSRDFGAKTCFAIEKRRVKGPVNRPECLEFSLDTFYNNAEKAKNADTTKINFTRCEAIIEKYKVDITAAQIAKFLNITERSTNRIIAKLVENGLLENQDIINYNLGQGRPTKRYKKPE